MVRRHVREGDERSARQEAIVTDWDRYCAPEVVILARVVWETMRSSLEQPEINLRRIEERSKS
jgi:hypothetical protein